MAQQQLQEEQGLSSLQSQNVRVPGSVSFNNFLTVSPTWSVSDSSSDLDTESTGSFFHDKTITLGSLLGSSNILELSKKSKRGKKKIEPLKAKNACKSKPWIFSLCAKADDSQRSKDNVDAPPSLGHFLAVERRTTSGNGCRSNQRQSSEEVANSLFVNGHVAPPTTRHSEADGGSRHGHPVLLLSCVCGQSS
ncbi:hypothetical protein LINGRAHAP2_LOCUS5831 [Linum grandiflorum]